MSVRNGLRTRSLLRQLEEVNLMDEMSCGDGCCGGDCCSPDDMKELSELESMVDDVLEEKSKKKVASVKATKKPAKKSSK
jgi:hypothetical protein